MLSIRLKIVFENSLAWIYSFEFLIRVTDWKNQTQIQFCKKLERSTRPLLIFQQSTLSSKWRISITVPKFNVLRKSWIRKSWKENWCSQGGRVGLVPLCPNSTHRCDYLAQVESWKRPRFARDPRRGTDATDAFQWDACHHARAGPFTCNRSRRSATYARIPPVARVILCSTVWRRSMIKGIDTRVCVSRLKNN